MVIAVYKRFFVFIKLCVHVVSFSFLRFHGRRHVVVSSRCFMCTGTGCIEIPTEWNLCKRARARSGEW